jgi:hypothetical protein
MTDPAESPAPETDRLGRNKWMIVVLVAASAVGAVGGQHLAKLGMDALRAPRVQPVNADDWKRQTLGDLTLETPLALVASNEVLNQLPAAVKEMIAEMEIHTSAKPESDLNIMVMRSKYRDGMTVSLDGAVAGGIGNGAREAGDPDPKYSVSGAEVSGLAARHGSYQGRPRGNPLSIETLCIQRDQQIWSVMVIFQVESTRAVAERILQSVRIGNP